MNIAKLYLISGALILGSCIGGGTHGSIKRYDFPVTKYNLENAIQKVIDSSRNVMRDTTRDHYNDGENYITIKISKDSILNTYTFRFNGDKRNWDTAKTSELFIAYAYDKEGNGGSKGNGRINLSPGVKRELLSLFESDFILKIDGELHVNHIESN